VSSEPQNPFAAPAATGVAPREATTDESRADTTRRAGRGGLAIAFAKVYFILTGLVQQVLLPRVLGLGGFGAWANAQSMASVAYNPVTTTSIQGVSRALAQSPDADQPAALRRTFAIHAVVAVVAAALFFVLAPIIARMMGAPHITGAVQILAAVLLTYGVYTPLVGALNGQQRFVHQAALDITAATLRTLLLVGGAWWFSRTYGAHVGLEGAASGFVASTVVVFLAALALVGLGQSGRGGPSTGQYIAFLVPLALGQILTNLLLQADLSLLRYFAADSAEHAGLTLTAADPLVGAYRATQLFAFLPYQLLLSVTFILFPMLATAYRDGDSEAVARYVKMGVRLALVLAGLMVSVTSGLAGPLLRLVFEPKVAELGTRSLQLLALGFGCFAIFAILTTVLTSLKRERASAVITALAVALVVGLCFLRVRGTAFGPELLWRTALATSSGLFGGTLVAGFTVWRTAKALAPLASVLKVLGATAATIAIARILPYHGKVVTLVWCAGVVAVYVAILIALRELGRSDLDLVSRVLGKKR
jgi:stage V sporulation protein B